MYTEQNTTGYTAEQLAALNAELAAILAEIDPDDTDALDRATKAHADEVASR